MKRITFYLDQVPSVTDSMLFHTYDFTQAAIDNGYAYISTTSLANLSFDLIDAGYDIYVVRNGIGIKFYPGMPSVGNKDIRKEHNLQRLIMGHYFDDDFKII